MLAILHRITPRHWHVVNDPVMLVVHEHPLTKECDLLLVLSLILLVLLGTQNLTGRVLQELDLVRRRPNSLSENNLSKVFCWRGSLVGLTEIKTAIE